MDKPTFRVIGDSYQFVWLSEGVEIQLDRFSEARDGLSAEILVTTTTPPSPGLLHAARFNLLSSQTRSGLARTLSSRLDSIDWAGVLEQVCFMSLREWREGDPVIDLATVDYRSKERWLLKPFVEQSGATIVFADGGAGKSTLALAMGLTVASGESILGFASEIVGPVLYLDWEADEGIHSERLHALAHGAGIATWLPVYYRRCVATLAESAQWARKEVARLGVVMVIIDSVGPAKGSEPEGADASTRLFGAARGFGVPWIGVDHVSKADSKKPFGSAYTHNLARITWAVESAQDEGQGELAVSLVNRKRNNGKLHKRLAYRIQHVTDHDVLESITFNSCQAKDVPAFASRRPLRERILEAFNGAKWTVGDMAKELGEEPRDIAPWLSRFKKDGLIVNFPDHSWGQVTSRQEFRA